MVSSVNNKRIAKNTLLLYFRTLFIMAVTLYTSRVVLNTLGVEDYGIYNVVGGIIVMFGFINSSMASATQRYITFALGRGDAEGLQRVFSTALQIHVLIAALVVLLGETVGLWFLYTKMQIPAGRMDAAFWVLQCSILSTVVMMVSVPYNADIIAHERMSAFAYISILEAAGKLGIAFLIGVSPMDRLVFYAILMCAVALVVRLAYGIYCKRHFAECTCQFIFDKDLLKRMFGFAGWNFIGTSSAVLRDQGGNVVINLFCGPAVNAARGIAFQVNSAIHGFVTNFMTALNPQITKSYASGDYGYMMTLIFQGARLSYYMLLVLSLPVLINTHYILCLWLKIVPEHAVLFVQLVLVFAMSESISGPLITAMLATGKIRNYQLVVGSLQMMNLPISYVLLRMGLFPEIVIVVAIFISQCCLAARLLMLRGMIGLSIRRYLKKVYWNVLMVTTVASVPSFLIANKLEESFGNFILSALIAVVCTGLSIFYVGCNRTERVFVENKFIKMIYKLNKR